jgi:acyl carrier protein phosphodiesterase
MNYLAHLRLSPIDAEPMTGNLMGDFRKYLDDTALPDKVSQGIKNHMRVDKFTDSSQSILTLKRLFSSERRRFAGIILDVSFDYFLIRHWQEFCDTAFDEFINQVHRNVASMSDIMPLRMQHVMDFMITEEWLRSYATLDGIGNALDRMSLRIRFENKLAGAIEEVEHHYEKLEAGFLEFFPELINHIENNK